MSTTPPPPLCRATGPPARGRLRACARRARTCPRAAPLALPLTAREGLRRGGGAGGNEERWIGRAVHGPLAMTHADDLAGSGSAGVARAKAAAIVATALARACARGGGGRGEAGETGQPRQSIMVGVWMSLATPLERKAYSESLGTRSDLALRRPGALAPAGSIP